jgi:hypothetical protein
MTERLCTPRATGELDSIEREHCCNAFEQSWQAGRGKNKGDASNYSTTQKEVKIDASRFVSLMLPTDYCEPTTSLELLRDLPND